MSRKQSLSIRARRAEYRAQQKRRRAVIALSIAVALIAVAIIAGILLQQPAITADEVVLPPTLESPPNAEGKAWGPADAPVLVEIFADFQCPFCARFAMDSGRQMVETYGGSGQVRVEYNHFAFIGPESRQAAQAAECAGEQGKFWQYHDTLFANQRGENEGAFSDDALRAFAAALELDEAAFEQCLASARYEDEVQADTAASQERGVRSTPTLFINEVKVEGALPFVDLQARIEAALAESGSGR